MRAERSWYYATLTGSFLTLVAYAMFARNGLAYEVRYAWLDFAPAMLSITALLGLALHGWRGETELLGKVLASAAIGGLATHLLLIIIVPLHVGESIATLLWPALDVLGWLALPAGILVAMEPRVPPRVSVWALRIVALVAFLLAARLLWNAWALPRPMRVGIAVSWASFVVAGGWAVIKLLMAKVTRPSPATTPR